MPHEKAICARWCAGTPGPDKRPIWIIARQHPGESMAEWFMQVGLTGQGRVSFCHEQL